MQNLPTNITADDSLVSEDAEIVDYGFDAYCDLRRKNAPHNKVRAQAQAQDTVRRKGTMS
jgi:hypothetical protein